MGIDIYAKWKGQTTEEEARQFTGFSVETGQFGYLREAYHGEPYVTKFLLKECWESKSGKANIPAKVLKDRLDKAIELAIEREAKVYNKKVSLNSPVVKSFIDFVKLCEIMEKKTGEACTILASY